MAKATEEELSSQNGILTAGIVEWPAVVWSAICIVCGVVAGSLLPTSPKIYFAILLVWLVTSACFRRACPKLSILSMYFVIVLLGICRWQFTQFTYEQNTIQNYARSGQSARLTAKIVSIPVASVRPAEKFSPRLYGTSQRSQFLADVQLMETAKGPAPFSGRLQVYIDGDATSVVCAGDVIQLVGNLAWPAPPGNPGQFDYQAYLQRQRIAATVFVNHPQAITVVHRASVFSLGRISTWLRRSARNAIVSSVDAKTEAVALALLLGSRHQLPSATEEAFVASGTMHLLAISGLHVGILCVFLLRFLNLLLVKRSTSLIVTGLVCTLYAVATDLRPSVLRATVFFWVYVAGQLTGRNQRPATLISLTVLLLVCGSPELVFDTGAWLSFLSVAALGWVSSKQSTVELQDDTPVDAFSIADAIQQSVVAVWKTLLTRYKQMLCILAVTTPLVAATFHVISPVGLIVNVILIPFAALILCFGFSTLLVGLISPNLAHLPGGVFSMLLESLQWIVKSTAGINAGHLYVPDFPDWFVPAYYILLIAILAIQAQRVRRFLVAGLMACIVFAFASAELVGHPDGIRCSVLSVGHGSAAVLETSSGRVMLIDAGAMNRGKRAADIVCSFLWNRGHRKIDSIFISHADMDHYNAVPEIMRRMPVGELVTSSEVVESDSTLVQSVLEYSQECGVAVRVLQDRQVANLDGAIIQVFQARRDALNEPVEDNERSLVVLIEYGQNRMLLPGDLEGSMANQLMQQIGPVEILVSPHHGSIAANLEPVAEAVKPKAVIVSARDASGRAALEEVFAASQAVHFTSAAGCVMVRMTGDAVAEVVPYIRNPEPSEL